MKSEHNCFIHAEKVSGNEYTAYELHDSIKAITNNYEYGDVYEGKYQIWEHPSGTIFKIVTDRKVADNDYYSDPDKGLWLPKIVKTGIDSQKVTEAYERLISSPMETSLIERIKRVFKKNK